MGILVEFFYCIILVSWKKDYSWPSLAIKFSNGVEYRLRPLLFEYKHHEQITDFLVERYSRLVPPSLLWSYGKTHAIMTDSATKYLGAEELITKTIHSRDQPYHLLCKTLRKIPYFHLISWCGNFVERHRRRRIARNYAETVSFHKISTPWNYVKLRYFTQWKSFWRSDRLLKEWSSLNIREGYFPTWYIWAD